MRRHLLPTPTPKPHLPPNPPLLWFSPRSWARFPRFSSKPSSPRPASVQAPPSPLSQLFLFNTPQNKKHLAPATKKIPPPDKPATRPHWGLPWIRVRVSRGAPLRECLERRPAVTDQGISMTGNKPRGCLQPISPTIQPLSPTSGPFPTSN